MARSGLPTRPDVSHESGDRATTRRGPSTTGRRRPGTCRHPNASPRGEGHGRDSGSKNQPVYRAIEWVYLAVLRFSLRQRWLVVVAVIGACVMGVLLLRFKMIAMNFLPDDDSSEFQVNVQAPEGTSLGGHASADFADRPRHSPLRRRPIHDCQRGRHRPAQPLPGNGLRPPGQHRRAPVRRIPDDRLRPQEHPARSMRPTSCGSA